MIQAILVINQKGKVRLQRIYDEQTFMALGYTRDQIYEELFVRTKEKADGQH